MNVRAILFVLISIFPLKAADFTHGVAVSFGASPQLVEAALMAGSFAGAPRLGAGIPPGATLAHKTGSSGVQGGVTVAYNDVGVLRLPSGRVACIASFIRDSRELPPVMNAAHAELARRVADHLANEQL